MTDPAAGGRYLLGVECDGRTYHSSATARDRDRLRQSVLGGLGWRLCRVWSTDWLRNREKQVRRVWEGRWFGSWGDETWLRVWGGEAAGRPGAAEGADMAEVYVSTDVEADGPIPGPALHAQLRLGRVRGRQDPGRHVRRQPDRPAGGRRPPGHDGVVGRPSREAWAACRADPRDPAVVMPEYVGWLKALPGKPVFVGYPAAYDFLFVYWYLIRFAGESPFSHSALDIKTYAMAVLGTEYRAAVKRNMPRDWFDPLPHTHVALDDARGQGRCSATCWRSATAGSADGPPAPRRAAGQS